MRSWISKQLFIKYICKKERMKNTQIFKIMFVFFIALSTTSCVSKKDMIYFQNDDVISNELLKNYAPRIQSDDVLSILVNATEPESVQPYNLYQVNGQAIAANSSAYLVDLNGEITFPELGKIYVQGLTTNELKDKLIELLKPFVNNPIITIQLENFRITVLGEVRNPGALKLENGSVSIPEAIGLAGDLTIQGKRKNILLIRKNGDKVESIRLDLTDKSIFSSPHYYVAQNDIIYVEPNRAKVNSSAIGTTSSLISIASALLSLILILTR